MQDWHLVASSVDPAFADQMLTTPLSGNWKLTDAFCHEDVNHVLVTASLQSKPNELGMSTIHMEHSASGFGGYKRSLMVVELPGAPPARTQTCEFDFGDMKAPFSALYFYSWRKDGYLRTSGTRFGSPCGEGWDCYSLMERRMAQGGTLTARIGTGTWRFDLDGFVPVGHLAGFALDIRQQPSFSDIGGFARSEYLLKDAGLAMSDIQNLLISEFAGLRLMVEGKLDLRYIQHAAQLLDKNSVLDRTAMTQVGGSGNLKKLWNVLTSVDEGLFRGPALLLFDCDTKFTSKTVGLLHRRRLCLTDNPLQSGIENLFGKPLLERAIRHRREFIDITSAHQCIIRGKSQTVPESWTVNPKEKTNLCDWICEHATADDFSGFQQVFDIIEDVLACA